MLSTYIPNEMLDMMAGIQHGLIRQQNAKMKHINVMSNRYLFENFHFMQTQSNLSTETLESTINLVSQKDVPLFVEKDNCPTAPSPVYKF